MIFLFIKYSFNEPAKIEKRTSIIKSGIEGYKVLLKSPSIKTVFFISSVIAIIGRFYETYKVAVADVLLNLNPEGIVYFDYALAIGGLAVPLIIKALSRRNHVLIFILATMITGAGYIVFGFSHGFIITFATLVILGLTQNMQGIYSRTIIQNSIPKEFIGRVFSFYKILLTIFAIFGLLIVTPLYKLVGIGYSFLIFSAILILLCVLYLRVGTKTDPSLHGHMFHIFP
jgi:MFS-type transporter involved in bile tolerance (Atg22 family)